MVIIKKYPLLTPGGQSIKQRIARPDESNTNDVDERRLPGHYDIRVALCDVISGTRRLDNTAYWNRLSVYADSRCAVGFCVCDKQYSA